MVFKEFEYATEERGIDNKFSKKGNCDFSLGG
jgi:hypothetical protein